MDPEETWRLEEALMNTAGGGTGEDGCDEDYDEDLLNNLPCAHDASAALKGVQLQGFTVSADAAAAMQAPPPPHMHEANSGSTIAAPLLLDPLHHRIPPQQLPVAAAAEKTGVLVFPPLGRTCFMMKGDNGVARWVTASIIDTKSAKAREGTETVEEEEGKDEALTHITSISTTAFDEDDQDDATCELQDRQRMRLYRTGTLQQQQQGTGHGESTIGLLGGATVKDLMQEVYESRAQDEARAAEAAAAAARLRTSSAAADKRKIKPLNAQTGTEDGMLWVSKYSPRHFREVLSDETVNLNLLRWLKGWDQYVFQGDKPSSSAAKGKAGLPGADSTSSQASLSRPEERIAVLVGPPGVGKTTLVHVLAVHCGYEVVEVNASVERTVSRLEHIIKTTVSSAGSAAHRVRHHVPSSSSSFSGANSISSPQQQQQQEAATKSLVDHLLRPKCLIIDEMDGISTNVANMLLQADIHRPVFCLCNDFYVSSLRPLRQKCQNIFHVPPIRPQRLLSRLQEIVQKEGRVVDQAALAELVRASGGDVRSCLNTLQFLLAALEHDMAQPTSSSTSTLQSTLEMIQHMQGKDGKLDMWESLALVFQKPERAKAIQLLKKECAVDYEALMEASAKHQQRALAHRRLRERARIVGTSELEARQLLSNGAVAHAGGDADEGETSTVTLGFRVDPGYMYASSAIARCLDTSQLLEGLQDAYLHRPYSDYTFARTSAAAEALSQQDLLTTAAFTRVPGLVGFAEYYEQVTALSLYAQCSSAARGERFGFPREAHQWRQVLNESSHTARTFREGCKGLVSSHLWCDEVVARDVAPLLVRCLFDRSLRLPSHPISSISALPVGEQKLMNAAVARHVEYGLTYRKSPSAGSAAPSSGSGGVGNSNTERGGGEAEAGGAGSAGFQGYPRRQAAEAQWRLYPEIDQLGGVRRPISGTAASSAQRVRGGLMPSPSTASAIALFKSSRTNSILYPMKDEIRQLLTGEIQRYNILQHTEAIKASTAGREVPSMMVMRQAALGTVASGGAAKRARGKEECDETKAKATKTEGKDETAAAIVAAAAAEAAKTEPTRRDFFGRIIQPKVAPTGGATTTAPTSGSARLATQKQSQQAMGKDGGRAASPLASHAKPLVRYTYHDGSTNAVKMPAVLADF